jgi:hypothetical protein
MCLTEALRIEKIVRAYVGSFLEEKKADPIYQQLRSSTIILTLTPFYIKSNE